MRRPLRGFVATAAAANLVFGVVACGGQKTAPSVPLGRLDVNASQEIAPGETHTLSAIAVMPNGDAVDVTGKAEWTSSARAVLEVTGAGRIAGRAPGSGIVTARYGGRAADATILVLPNGTFHLAGRVLDGDIGVANVVVTVTDGVGQGLSTRTGANGRYELYGVAGRVHLELTRDGDLAAVQTIDVSAHRSLNFDLTPLTPDRSYAGLYALVIEAGMCEGTFPESGKRRVYTARVEQTGASLRVSLSDADIWRGSGVFAGTVGPSGEISFTIRPSAWWDFDAFDLIENLPDGSSVIVQGSIVAHRTATGVVGRPGDPYDSFGLGIRLNQHLGGWCNIGQFRMLPRSDPGG